jgi:hypothetical protein
MGAYIYFEWHAYYNRALAKCCDESEALRSRVASPQAEVPRKCWYTGESGSISRLDVIEHQHITLCIHVDAYCTKFDMHSDLMR